MTSAAGNLSRCTSGAYHGGLPRGFEPGWGGGRGSGVALSGLAVGDAGRMDAAWPRVGGSSSTLPPAAPGLFAAKMPSAD